MMLLVTPKNGRIAKARQVKAFRVDVGSPPEDLPGRREAFKRALLPTLAHHARSKRLLVIFPETTALPFSADVWCYQTQTTVAEIHIEELRA